MCLTTKLLLTLWAMDFIKYKRCKHHVWTNQSYEKIFYNFYGSSPN